MLEIWLKAFHIAFLSVWAGGLVALPALIGPRMEPDAGEHARRLRVTRLAFEVVVSPAAVFTVASGAALVFVASWETPWLAAKLGFVGGMGLLHMLIGRGLARRSARLEPGPAGRAAITVMAVALISAVLGLVLGKPEIGENLFPAFLREGRPDGFLEGLLPSGLLSRLVADLAAAGPLLPVLLRRFHPETVLEHELAAVPAGEADEHELEARQEQSPGQHRLRRVPHAMRPAQRQHADQGHRDDAVRPARGPAARARHEHHLAEPRQGGRAAHHEGRAGAPEARTGEEGVESPPIGRVRASHPEDAGDREGDEHRVDRMAEERDAAVEILDGVGLAERRGGDVGSFGAHRCSFVRAACGIAAAATLAGCGGPLSTVDPAGPVADRVATLWWIMLSGATVILVGVCLLALIPFLQARRGDTVSSRAPRDAVWLWGGGLAFPLVTLFALMLYAFAVDPIDDAARTGAEPVKVEAVARQWVWTFVHPDAPGGPLTTEGRLHIPAGRPVEVAIASEDVIHSFWVPRLAGKRDAIPGRTNTITILADRPGVYGALCAEFCGWGHAGMSFEVIAHEESAYRGALARLAAEAGTGLREARR